MLRSRLATVFSAVICCVTLASCGSDATAPPPTGIHIVAGAGQTDTVGATLALSLVVQINSPALTPHTAVDFTDVPYDEFNHAYAYVHRVGASVPAQYVIDTVNSRRQATVQIVLGSKAGPAPILVSVPDLGLLDTVTFTVLPGHAFRIVASPTDTILMVGTTDTLHSAVVDRVGNSRPDPVTYSVVSGSVGISGQVVTATAAGPAIVRVSADGMSDSSFFGIVPLGRLAAGDANGIALVNLDGTDMQQVPGIVNGVGALRWSPAGTSLVFDQTNHGGNDGTPTLRTITLGGTIAVVDVSALGEDQWPQWSRDGSTIYWSNVGTTSSIWHATPTGGNDDSVSTQSPSFDISPSPSPDGTQLAYVADLGSTSDLRILTLATGAVADLHTVAWAPVWAPSGQRIAYLNQSTVFGRIAIVNADGTNAHVLTSALYYMDMDWSPDGQWLVAVNANTLVVDMINSTTGATVPLPFTFGYWSPAWQPGSNASPSRARLRRR
jgi:hypothetical protein